MKDKQYLTALNEIASLVGFDSVKEYLEANPNQIMTILKDRHNQNPNNIALLNDLESEKSLIFIAKEIEKINNEDIQRIGLEEEYSRISAEKKFFYITAFGATGGFYFATENEEDLPEKILAAAQKVETIETASVQVTQVEQVPLLSFGQRFVKQHQQHHTHDSPHSPFKEGLRILRDPRSYDDSSKLSHLFSEQGEIFSHSNSRQGIAAQYGSVVMPEIGVKTAGSGTGISLKALREIKKQNNGDLHIGEVGIHNDNLAADNRVSSQLLVNQDGTYNAKSIFSNTFVNLDNLSNTRFYGTTSLNELGTFQNSMNLDYSKAIMPENLEGKKNINSYYASTGYDVSNFPQNGGFQGDVYGRLGYAWNSLNSTTSLTLVGNQQVFGNQFISSNFGFDFTYTRAIDGYSLSDGLAETKQQSPQYREAYFSFGKNPIEQTNYFRVGYNEDRSDINPEQFIRAIHGEVSFESGPEDYEVEAEIHGTAKLAPNLTLNFGAEVEATTLLNEMQPSTTLYSGEANASLASMVINKEDFKLLVEAGGSISSTPNPENTDFTTTQAGVDFGAHAVIGKQNPITLSAILNMNAEGNILNPKLEVTETPFEFRASAPLILDKKKNNTPNPDF